MFKKSVSILFLVLASSLYLGHSLFLHTHVEEHHHHNEGSEDNTLSHFFCHLNHSCDFFSNNHIEDTVKTNKKVPDSIVLVQGILSFTNSIGFYFKKEVIQNKDSHVFISPHLHSLQFRGPPTLFI
ncbi:hypothetical protein [uncultured Flavobacterium sp.]|uniref:hypothetical protein n=1 Tax=uncultured Flavobacterium sp. TaxID=165435 RepID=UPI0030CA19E7